MLVRYLKSRIKTLQVYYIPIPINTQKFKPVNNYTKRKIRQLYKVPINSIVVTYIGNIHPDRGIFSLLNAVRILKSSFKNIVLVVVFPPPGGPIVKWYYLKFRELINKYTLRDRVILLQGIYPVSQIYSFSDIIVLPFKRVHMITDPPVVVAEALASATPLITTPIGSICDLASFDKCLFSKPGDSADLADKISALIEDRTLAKKIACNARKFAEKNLSYESISRRIMNLYTSLGIG